MYIYLVPSKILIIRILLFVKIEKPQLLIATVRQILYTDLRICDNEYNISNLGVNLEIDS
jgi:hypothetical protein